MTFRTIICFLFVVCTAIGTLTAQSLPKYRRMVITKIGETPVGAISDMTEDDRGFLWLGGQYGLYRYDGTSLEVFTNRPEDSTSIVPGAYIQVKKSRRNAGLWLGSNISGMSYLDLRTTRAQNFVADPGNPKALAGNEIDGLYEDEQGGIWVGTNLFTLHYMPPPDANGRFSGLFQHFQPSMPPGRFADYTAAGPLGEIIPDRHDPNLLWVGSRFGVYRFDRRTGTFHLFPFASELVFWYRQLNLQMFMDSEGHIWCGGSSTGLCRLDPANGTWRIFQKHGQSPEIRNANTVTDIREYGADSLLILTSVDDTWTMDCRRQTIEFFTVGGMQPIGVAYPMLCAHQTRNGDLWVAYSAGIIRLTHRPNPWPMVYFPARDPKLDRNNWQRSYVLSPDSQQLYLGTLRGNGLLAFDLRTEHIDVFSYRHPENREQTDVLMNALCFDRSGCLWVGSDTGLLYLEKQARRILPFVGSSPDFELLRDAQVSALLAQGDTLWVGTKGRGLFRVDMLARQVYGVLAEGLSANSTVNCLLRDTKGRVWIGHDRGLTAWDLRRNRTWWFNRKIPPPQGLSNNFVTRLALDSSGHLWISSMGGGMMRLRSANPEQPYFDAYYNNEVPGGNLVYEFVFGDHGQIWMGAQSGFVVLDTTTKAVVNYDNRDGMFAKIGALIRVPNGKIVSGAHQGFHYFYPDSVLHSGLPPVPYLKRFKVFERAVDLPEDIDRIPELSLAHNQNHFSFELGALNFDDHARTWFAYRLQGYDQDWVYSDTRSYISYTNLPAGTYTLHLKAANKHGTWSIQEKQIRIIIRPPYWQTWWFRLLSLLAVLAICYGLYRAWMLRQRTLRAQQVVAYFANAEYANASVRDILWDVSHNCMARLGLEDCVIYLLDESGEFLVQEAAYGAKSPILFEIKDPLHIPLGQGIVGSVGLKGQAELVPDTRRDPRYIVDDQPRLSEMAVPILHDNRVIGVIDSEHSKRGFFTEYHLGVVKTIASLCADKIAHARAKELMLEKERQLRELNQNLAESQLTALRAQMNPHFLFNCLNSINWYIIKNKPAEASRYIAKFSRLIRLILEHSQRRLIPLAEELEALRLYLDMEAMRFEQRFEYRIDLAPDLDPDEAMVPPLIFQPYIENAIWHGLMPKQGAGHLLIALRPDGDSLLCTIEDDGIGREAAAAMSNHHTRKRQSQGLKITEARIRQANGKSNGQSPVRFTDLYNGEGQAAGTRVEVRIG